MKTIVQYLMILALGVGIGQGSFGDINRASVGPFNIHMAKRHLLEVSRKLEAVGRGDYRSAGLRY
ncbi:hypothetical protein P7L87_26390 [Vibrio parahaemolyticus]|nr:hypothetical protein [Vibrio parahaemolyticus]